MSTIVSAQNDRTGGKRYDKLPAHKRTGKNVYLQAQCGHLVDSEGWKALLKRATKCVDEAKQTTTKVNATKAVRFLVTSCMLSLVDTFFKTHTL